ncbi:MAG: nitroreductase family protein [Candidatus Omnitrophota bacterium]
MLKDLLEKRQSSRTYEQTHVPTEDILKCIQAAQLAPSACNSQPWHFIVINDPIIKKNLSDHVFNGPYQMNIFAKQAPVIIACVSEKTPLLLKTAGYLRRTPFYLIDIGIAMEHFVLQAQELNLSTCWIGWFNERWARKILEIPANKKIVCLLTLGYSREEHREKKRKNIKDIYSFNHY